MANKIKYHGKIRLNFAKVFSILQDKTTVMDYTVDSQRKNYYKSRNKKELQFHKTIAESYEINIQKFYRYVNVKFKDTLPSNFWQKFNIERDTARVQVMCHKPGTVSIPHVDKYNSFLIDEKYGGIKLSTNEISSILTRISSVDPSLGVITMVPNSLGPAELLVHYGTQDQKDYYLPRLAIGQEIPCFALTEAIALFALMISFLILFVN